MQKFLDKNLIISPWVPQIPLLWHNKTKVFITHGGMKRFFKKIIIDFLRKFDIFIDIFPVYQNAYALVCRWFIFPYLLSRFLFEIP